MSTTRKHFYAVIWHYGRGCTTDGPSGVQAACGPIRFDSPAERQAWIDCGADYVTEGGYREAITLSETPYGWSKARFVRAAADQADYEDMLAKEYELTDNEVLA